MNQHEYQEGAYEIYPEGLVTDLYARIFVLEKENRRLAEQVDNYREGEYQARHGVGEDG